MATVKQLEYMLKCLREKDYNDLHHQLVTLIKKKEKQKEKSKEEKEERRQNAIAELKNEMKQYIDDENPFENLERAGYDMGMFSEAQMEELYKKIKNDDYHVFLHMTKREKGKHFGHYLDCVLAILYKLALYEDSDMSARFILRAEVDFHNHRDFALSYDLDIDIHDAYKIAKEYCSSHARYILENHDREHPFDT